MKELSIEEKAKAYDEAVINGSRLWECDKITREDYEYIFPALKESEDERIRKALKEYFINSFQNNGVAAICGVHIKDILAWLEKQGEHANFRNKIQIGDKVTRNEDGVLVNLSQLKRVAKKDEKQGEQNPVWSQEDEDILNTIINHFKVDIECTDEDDMVRWLKSLKDRYTWKPSEEQMKMLNEVLNFAANHESPHWNYYIFGTLNNLISQFKKLSEG